MTRLHRATSGFHQHGFRAEMLPDRPTHAAELGDRLALCGAPVEHVFVRRWAEGPEMDGCPACLVAAALLRSQAEVPVG